MIFSKGLRLFVTILTILSLGCGVAPQPSATAVKNENQQNPVAKSDEQKKIEENRRIVEERGKQHLAKFEKGCKPAKNLPDVGDKIFVGVGAVSIEKGTLVSYSSIWSGWNGLNVKEGMTFDLMNESGFIARACALEKDEGGAGWLLSIDPNSVRANVTELDKGDNIWTFAVYPSRSERGNIKINSQKNQKPLLTSLPKKDQNNVERYTDLNGDGTIDLVEVNGPCSGKADDDLSCSKILVLIDGKWKQVAYITPA